MYFSFIWDDEDDDFCLVACLPFLHVSPPSFLCLPPFISSHRLPFYMLRESINSQLCVTRTFEEGVEKIFYATEIWIHAFIVIIIIYVVGEGFPRLFFASSPSLLFCPEFLFLTQMLLVDLVNRGCFGGRLYKRRRMRRNNCYDFDCRAVNG